MQIIKNEIMLGDCMDLLAELPDKSIDLAIVDPPYGIGAGSVKFKNGTSNNNIGYKIKDWDVLPDKEYFNELIRISQNQIIWGGNYFLSFLFNTKCFIVWDKMTGSNSYADAELAWTSFNSPIKIYKKLWLGANAKNDTKRIHPTEKPVALYRWILQKYAKPGQLILDTHSGSGSLACACHIEKFDFIAIEKDPHYHALSVKRLEELRSQGVLF